MKLEKLRSAKPSRKQLHIVKWHSGKFSYLSTLYAWKNNATETTNLCSQTMHFECSELQLPALQANRSKVRQIISVSH